MKREATEDGRRACGGHRDDDARDARAVRPTRQVCDARAEMAAGDGGGDDGLDPPILAVLLQLREAAVDARGAPWSLAKLGKRAGVPMSTLRRTLTRLDAAGVTETMVRDDGAGRTALTAQGLRWCDALFAGGAHARCEDA
ncbi:DNA-binding protein [Burkholderia thailandensis]|uniref:DNA-binding protein n=1 Tax=Burkholderia thailandensis TaxID=57975 RepID=UPI00016A4EE4|nr:DNA-binding protein [Burkholderia thailandensis]AIP66263.1 DNA-binding protein [Burkholderia thailandensis]AOI54658.1 DNA-binding protein [Burkholderia thailandensis]TGB35535.1 DNA-binding protein [Burkholderia thailandensis]